MPTTPAIICAMQDFGGGFVRKLADAYVAADPVNRGRIEAAFPDVFERYARMAEKLVVAGEARQS